jgi:signal transduction histidine kinase
MRVRHFPERFPVSFLAKAGAGFLGMVASFGCAVPARAEEGWIARLLNPPLRSVADRMSQLQRQLDADGVPVVGQTSGEIGFQHRRQAAPPPVAPWVEVDLGQSRDLDWIALFPAQVDWQSMERPSYGFPRRFRIDVSEDPQFLQSQTVADLTESDFPDPGVGPVSWSAKGLRARYVRVTVTKLANENGQYFFALAELMVLEGHRNVAIHCAVNASSSVDIGPRWSRAHLVDGRTPVGPPIRRELLPYDGLYMGPDPAGGLPWVVVDLGREYPLQEVRLHAVHARIGADIPGFNFPKRFLLEASPDREFSAPVVLLDASRADYPNPGSNPVTVPVKEAVSARFVRVRETPLLPGSGRRFGLSELEVYSGGENVARGAAVESVPDPAITSVRWPRSSLVDGYTSYGRLLDLPEWIAGWNRRRQSRFELTALAAERAQMVARTQRRLEVGGILLAGSLLGLGVGMWWWSRRRREHELKALRLRLARDLHDEIGSNLAGIAVLGELGADSNGSDPRQQEDWREVQRAARQSMDSMREVLWLMDAREDSGHDFARQLQVTAARMLAGQEVVWTPIPEVLPARWTLQRRRQAFLIFKEALANIVRHARATRVELSLICGPDAVELAIADNGCGFDVGAGAGGMGLASMRERARSCRAVLEIHSESGRGTRVCLRSPF